MNKTLSMSCRREALRPFGVRKRVTFQDLKDEKLEDEQQSTNGWNLQDDAR